MKIHSSQVEFELFELAFELEFEHLNTHLIKLVSLIEFVSFSIISIYVYTYLYSYHISNRIDVEEYKHQVESNQTLEYRLN